jgi:predicted Zn-dependent protease with MMP-like domain
VAAALQNVTVSVEDLPPTDELLLSSPPLSPQLMGLWRGTPLSERTVFDPWSEMPGAIALYQKNLQRFAHDEHELTEQIRITVLHEVGHALGLDEQALIERGLE